MTFVDRMLTIVITATLTSAVWIVAGGSLIENSSAPSQLDVTRPAEAAPSPEPNPEPSPEAGEELAGTEPAESEGSDAQTAPAAAPALDRQTANNPTEAETRTLLIPVLNIRAGDLTDTFRTSGPVAQAGGGSLHEALDIMAPLGTSVVAAAPGIVERLYRSQTGGNTIYIRSADRETIHYYAHLDEYAQGLSEGQRIRRGQRLGTVGNTGNGSQSEPHLHFAIFQTTKDAEWWEPANAINPYPLFTR
jgi:murein DD-endopeptidase MepM/ murein hydrolase activator NlpD